MEITKYNDLFYVEITEYNVLFYVEITEYNVLFYVEITEYNVLFYVEIIYVIYSVAQCGLQYRSKFNSNNRPTYSILYNAK